MDEERIHYHEITISERTYPYYLISCGLLELPDDDYSLEFEGEELIKLESARLRRWLNAIAKHNEKIWHQWNKFQMIGEINEKEFDSEKFKAFTSLVLDFHYDFINEFETQNCYNTVFRMIAEENSHASRMSNLESTVLRLEKKIDSD